MEKTVIVVVNRLVLHPVYKKYMRKKTKVKAMMKRMNVISETKFC